MYHTNPTIDALMKRAYLYLEDRNWQSAKSYFDRCLDMDPENAKAYVGMVLADCQIKSELDLYLTNMPFAENENYKKALRFADEAYRQKLEQYAVANTYVRANKRMEAARKERDFREAAALFGAIPEYKDAAEKAQNCQERGDALCAEAAAKAEADLKKRTKTVVTIMAIVLALGVAFTVITSIASNKKAAEIHDNFLGESFYGKHSDDDGFVAAYNNNTLNNYKIYWLDKDVVSLDFNEDGTVEREQIFELSVLAWSASMTKPDGSYNRYNDTYESFEIKISPTGKVYLHLGSSKYEVLVNDNNEPTHIYYSEEITLR